MWLTNSKLWDGTSEELMDADALNIENGIIVTIGSSEDVSGEQIDCSGLTLIPGLIDAHVHMCLDPDIKDPLAQDKFTDSEIVGKIAERCRRMLESGITTARDLGGGNWLELAVRDQINAGELVGTRLVCAGQPVTSVQGHCHFWGGEASTLEEALEVIERQDAHNVDLIKIMATGGSLTAGSTPANSQFQEDDMRAMVELAKSKGYRVAAHCHGTEGVGNAAGAEVTTIEHCSWVGDDGWGRNFDQAIAEKIVSNDVCVSPTINAGWQRYVGSKSFEGMIKENYRKMKAAGVKLIASTDAGIPGVHHVDFGKAIPVFAHFAELSNTEALRSATSDCAEAIGLGDTVGQIKVGYIADIVGYEGNPLEDLKLLEKPALVISKGLKVELQNN